MKREVYSQTIQKTTLNITQSRVDSVRKNQITRSACRVYENGCIGISGFFGQPTQQNWKAAEENLALGIPYEYPPEEGKKRTEDRREELLDEKQLLCRAEELLAQLSRRQPEFIFSNKILSLDITQTLTGEKGLSYEYRDRVYQLSIIFKHKSSNAVFDGGLWMESRRWDSETFLRDACEQLDAHNTPARLPSAPVMPVVLSFGLVGEPILRGLSAEALGKGTSIFAGRLGEKLFSSRFTLFADRSAESLGESFFDKEGSTLAGDRIPLIENGVLKRGFCDKKNAAEFGFENTAAAGGSYDDVPALGENSVLAAPGEKTLKELLGEGEAILIDTMSGGDCTAEGNCASPVQLAYLLRNGKPVGRLPEFSLSGNLYEMFGKDYLGVSADKPFFDRRALVLRMKVN